MTCQQCGKQLPESAQFCGHCGAEVHRPRFRRLKRPSKQFLLRLCLTAALVLLLGGAAAWVGISAVQKNQRIEADYQQALTLIEQGRIDRAMDILEDLGKYKDSQTILSRLARQERDYGEALRLQDEGQWEQAMEILESLGDYRNSPERVQQIRQNEDDYQQALILIEAGRLQEAADLLLNIGNHRDSLTLLYDLQLELEKQAQDLATYEQACDLLQQGLYRDAFDLFLTLGDYADSQNKLSEAALLRAKEMVDQDPFLEIGEYLAYMSAEHIKELEEYYYDNCVADRRVQVALRDAMAHLANYYSGNTEDFQAIYEATEELLQKYADMYYEDFILQSYVESYRENMRLASEYFDYQHQFLHYLAEVFQQVELLHKNYSVLEGRPDLQNVLLGQVDGLKEQEINMMILQEIVQPLIRLDTLTYQDGFYYTTLANTSNRAFTLIYQIEYLDADGNVIHRSHEYISYIDTTTRCPIYLVPDMRIPWASYDIRYEIIYHGNTADFPDYQVMVLDKNGNPVKSAMVMLMYGHQTFSLYTDSNGIARWYNISYGYTTPGKAECSTTVIYAPGYKLPSEPVYFPNGQRFLLLILEEDIGD